MGDPLFAAPDLLGQFIQNDAGAEFLDRLVGVGLADEQKVATGRHHGLADRLAGEQIVAEIHRLEPGIPCTMRRQPAPCSAAFAVLLVVSVLGDDELRLQRHGAVMARRDQRGGEHGVEILDLVLAALAMGAVRTVDLVGAMEFGAVQRDQHMSIEAAHGIQTAALLKFGHDIGEHRVKHGRFDRVEFRADLAVAGDFAHAEQCLAVRTALAGLQMALVCQKRRALHEERGERGEREMAMA